jgi:hypothetical protein
MTGQPPDDQYQPNPEAPWNQPPQQWTGPPPGYGTPGYGTPGYGTPGYGTPGYGGYGTPGPPPPNYLVQAILATLFCCLPLGIVAIVFAAQVSSKWAGGDYAGAQNASNQAKTFCWISFGLGLVGAVIWIIAAASASSGTSGY